MDWIGTTLAHLFQAAGAPSIAIAMALLVITDRLVWHTRLTEAKAERDRWQAIAIGLMQTGVQAGVKSTETVADFVEAIPTKDEIS